MNGDIRAFFQKTSKKPAEVIEKKTIDIAKDIKEIKIKTKNKRVNKPNPQKTKVQAIEPDIHSVKEENDQLTLKKKKTNFKTKIESKEIDQQNKNTPLTKSNLIRNKKKIIDDDDIELNDMIVNQYNNKKEILPQQEYTIEEKPKIILKQVIKPIEKKEKLINIEVSDYFSMTSDEVKNKFKELEEKQINVAQIDNDVEMKDIYKKTIEEKKDEADNTKMEVDKEDNDPFLDINLDEVVKDLFDHTDNKDQIKESPQIKNDIFKSRPIILESIEKAIKPINQNKPSLQKPIEQISGTSIKPAEILYQLWSEKYKPKNKSEIIGNAIAVNQLSDWLDHWDEVVLNGVQREVPSSSYGKGRKGINNVNARAAIVSGAPGIGKTSTVRLIASLKNYRTFELNASDQRNKEIINNSVGFLMNNKTLTADKELSTKNLIIMDEVDGMGGNQDKGGISALINIVKKSKIPIIFICNDIYSQKLKSLINHCYDIRFSKPDKRLVVNRLYSICQKEKVKIDQQALDYLCGGFNCDIRQCLNYLELASKGNGNNIKEKSDKFKKDDGVVINSFEGCKKLLNKSESCKLNFSERMDLFYIDYDLIPLLVFENYLSCYGNYHNNGDLDKICQVSQALSFSDVIETRIRYKNDWGLLPDKGIQSVLIPSVINGGSLSFPKFPELYAKISKMSKTKRQVKEIKMLIPQTSIKSIKHEVAPLLFSLILNNLVSYGKDGIDKIIIFFSQLKSTLTQIKDTLFDLQSENMMSVYTKLNNAIKSALTKRLNEQSNSNIANKRGTKKDKTTIQHQTIRRDIDGNLLEDIDQNSNDEDDDNEDDSSSIFEAIPKAKKPKPKQEKKK